MVATYKELKRQIADLEKKADEARKLETVKVIEDIKVQIAEYDLTPGDLFEGIKFETKPKTKVRASAAVNPPKYMDPKSGKTWNGIGKPPEWISSALKNGKNDDFLISVVTAALAAKDTVKPGTEKTVPANSPVKSPAKAVKPVKATVATKATTKAKTPAAAKRKPSAKPAAPSSPAKAPASGVAAAPAAEAPAEQSGS